MLLNYLANKSQSQIILNKKNSERILNMRLVRDEKLSYHFENSNKNVVFMFNEISNRKSHL